MKFKIFLNFLYLILISLILIPKVYAQNILEVFGDFFNVDSGVLIITLSLFFIIFFVLQKAAKMIFGNKVIVNIISLLLSLLAVNFMPPELIDFFLSYAILIIALAVILAPHALLDILGIRSKSWKHVIILILYLILIFWVFPVLGDIPLLEDILDIEFPLFFFGDVSVNSIIILALVLGAIYSLIVLIKDINRNRLTNRANLAEIRSSEARAKESQARAKESQANIDALNREKREKQGKIENSQQQIIYQKRKRSSRELQQKYDHYKWKIHNFGLKPHQRKRILQAMELISRGGKGKIKGKSPSDIRKNLKKRGLI